MKHNICCIVIACLLCACTTQNKQAHTTINNDYAKGFAIFANEHYTQVDVYQPNNTANILARYYLTEDDHVCVPKDGMRIKIPLTRIATTSATHIGFLKALNCLSSIVGVCNPSLIYTPLNHVVDLGDAMHINIEKVMQVQPQAVFVSAYGGDDYTVQSLKQMDIPIIYLTEWTEQTPLARMEWIRLIGAFFGQQQTADSICINERDNYIRIQKQKYQAHKTVMVGNNYRGTWYVPTGNTYMGQLLIDAGFHYTFANDMTPRSLPLSLENILVNFAQADIWLGAPTHTMAELANMDSQHTLFNAYKTNQVYHFMKRSTPQGANDFWESGVCQPATILNDLNQIANDSIVDLFFVAPLQ